MTGERAPGGQLYRMNICTLANLKRPEVNLTTGPDLLQVVHKRMGHQKKRHVRKIAKRELGIDLPVTDGELCEGCVYGKSHRLPFGDRTAYRATKPGEIVHSDICGPFMPSASKKEYFVLFKDDFTRYRTVFFVDHKSDACSKLNEFLASSKALGHTVQTFRCDGGGEFDNSDVKTLLSEAGIQFAKGIPYTPELNGCAERDNRTIVEAARSIFHSHVKLPQSMWAEIIQTAVYILTRTGNSSIPGKTPYELWYGRKPKITHLRVIGTTAYAHIPKQKRDKLARKANRFVLIGYQGDDGYRLYGLVAYKLIFSRSVKFAANPAMLSRSPLPDASPDSPAPASEAEGATSLLPVPATDLLNSSDSDLQLLGDLCTPTQPEPAPIADRRTLRARTQLSLPVALRNDFIMAALATIGG